jgi:hypothetical protein
MKSKPLFVETLIEDPKGVLFSYTQNPKKHQLWDLRFSTIDYQPKCIDSDFQFFKYTTKLGFGLEVSGEGRSNVHESNKTGQQLSVLRFWSNSPLALIRKGGGYWRYQREGEKIRFSTRYSYKTRWGLVGRIFDKLIFKPLMHRTTALSFDSLKRFIELKIPPAQSVNNYLVLLLIHFVLAFLWIYQGVVPKLMFPETGEITMLQKLGVFKGYENDIVQIIGWLEIGFGLCFLSLRHKALHYLNITALLVLGTAAVTIDLNLLKSPFNVVAMNVPLITLSVMALMLFNKIPRVSNCTLKQ